MQTTRRNFLKGFAASAVLASAGETFAKAEQKAESRILNRSDFTLESNVEITEPEWHLLINTVNQLSRRYPGPMNQVVEFKIIDGGTQSWGGAGPITAYSDKYRVYINFHSLKSPEVFRQLMTHEFGHILKFYLTKQQRIDQGHLLSLYREMERLSDNGSQILQLFNGATYLSEESKTAIQYKGYHSTWTADHLFTGLLEVRELFWKDFKTRSNGMTLKEKSLIEQAMALLPQPSQK